MERAVLVGIKLKKEKIPLEESLAELRKLTQTAGASIISELCQLREMPDQKYFIGSGKLLELKDLVDLKKADLMIIDHDISPSQTRNLEAFLEVKVIDRTELILDIFAQHALTREGKLQVELAQDEYRLTRLTGRGKELSRLGGGIGTRGPGETKLEMDRRRIRKRISLLKKEIESVREKRSVLRAKRHLSNIKTAALIGYTNSGKSTLLNCLTSAKAKVQDQLFATLDPMTRRLYLPSGKIILLTDTVGFIRKLPHHLINAFRATLEETIEADLLVHVIDLSSKYLEDQIEAVYTVLEELKAIAKPILTVLNKSDLLKDKIILARLLKKYRPAVPVSAYYKKNTEELAKALDRLL